MERVDLGRIQEWSINQAMRGEKFRECSRKKGEFSGMRKFQRLDVDDERHTEVRRSVLQLKRMYGFSHYFLISITNDFLGTWGKSLE